MSGSLSVPLTFATTYVSDALSKGGLAVLAFVCIWYAAYRVWADERKKLTESESRLEEFIGEEKRLRHALDYPPKIRARNFTVENEDAPGTEQSGIPKNSRLRGQFMLENKGGSSCKIVEVFCRPYWFVDGLPMARPYEGEIGERFQNTEIAKGESIPMLIPMPFLERDLAPHIRQYREKGDQHIFDDAFDDAKRFYLMGFVAIKDANGNSLPLYRFCREFRSTEEGGPKRFFPVSDTDYEGD